MLSFKYCIFTVTKMHIITLEINSAWKHLFLFSWTILGHTWMCSNISTFQPLLTGCVQGDSLVSIAVVITMQPLTLQEKHKNTYTFTHKLTWVTLLVTKMSPSATSKNLTWHVTNSSKYRMTHWQQQKNTNRQKQQRWATKREDREKQRLQPKQSRHLGHTEEINHSQ